MKSTKMLWLLLVACAATLVLGCSGEKRRVSTYEGVNLEQNIVFHKAGDVDLMLDIAWPKGKGPFPAIVYLFGSGWGHWSASRISCLKGIVQAANREYVAVQVDYRQTSKKVNGVPKYPFPAQIQDVKAAVRWLRANARRYGIDPSRLGVIGFSSGGHLALLVGLTRAEDGFEGDTEQSSTSSSVQAVVSCAGLSDLAVPFPNYEVTASIRELIGGPLETNRTALQKASPINYIRSDAPPILLLHGSADNMVPVDQALKLADKLRDAKVEHELVVKDGVSHVDLSLEPVVLDFMDRHLKQK